MSATMRSETLRPFARLAGLLAALVALAAGGCAKTLTELVVMVDTDMQVPQVIDGVDIYVTGPSMGQPLRAHASLSGNGAVTFPVSLSLVPASNDRLTPITISVLGLHGTDTVVSRTVRTGFVANQRRMVPVLLQRVCVGVGCPNEQTCVAHSCVAPDVEPGTLPMFTGPVNELDGGRRDACVPHTEICNGLDDDCDGIPDNGIDMQTDPNNCGMCGHVCMLDHTQTNTCVAGECVPALCASGFGDCDNIDSNGCESSLTSLTHCGMCGTTCMRDHATATCATRSCAIDQCTTGFADCDTTDSNGCESPLDTPAHCGNCATVCRYPHATPLCTSGACAMGMCDANYADCDANPGTGCESDLRTNSMHCGRCTHACAIGISCNNSVCDNEHIAELAGGAQHTCIRRELGGVLCWGANDSGQLGDGTTAARTTPVSVLGLTDADALAAGENHTCVHRGGTTGSVQCWGNNDYGQLGNGTTTRSSSPVTVTSLTGATQVTAGLGHSCARLGSGALRCWGLNINGQLGDGTTTQRTLPVAVSGIATASSVAAGAAHTCAMLASGAVSCWGGNSSGQLGDGSTMQRTSPVSVGIFNASAIAAGDFHTCALLSDYSVRCWGDNRYGQLGDGTTTMISPSPVPVLGLTDAVAIVAGQSHTCAQRMSGAVVCWGFNSVGQIGDGTSFNRNVPTAVSAITDATGLTAGSAHSCAMNASSVVRCWGSNSAGQLGNGLTGGSVLTPVTVMNLP